MSSFCVLRVNGSPHFEVEKLDLNLWILPGILGRRVVFCDVGLKLKPAAASIGQSLRFQLGLPFTTKDPVLDLTPLFFQGNAKYLLNAVFGNNATPASGGTATRYDDGEGVLVISSIDAGACKLDKQSRDNKYSIFSMQIPNLAIDDESLYARFRFRVFDPGRVWSWHKVARRRMYAISDMRVNEFRETPRLDNAPDFAHLALPIAAVHCLVIFSSKLRTGQVGQEPRYIRVLERSIWEMYLERKVSRTREVFKITYWRKLGVAVDSPFRSFLEVERRRANVAVPTLLFAIVIFVLFILVIPRSLLHQSMAWGTLLWIREQVRGVITVAVILTIVGYFQQFAPRSEWLRKVFRGVEDRWFKI